MQIMWKCSIAHPLLVTVGIRGHCLHVSGPGRVTLLPACVRTRQGHFTTCVCSRQGHYTCLQVTGARSLSLSIYIYIYFIFYFYIVTRRQPLHPTCLQVTRAIQRLQVTRAIQPLHPTCLQVTRAYSLYTLPVCRVGMFAGDQGYIAFIPHLSAGDQGYIAFTPYLYAGDQGYIAFTPYLSARHQDFVLNVQLAVFLLAWKQLGLCLTRAVEITLPGKS